MGKSKSLGFQIHSALLEINLQDKEKRTDIFNKENDTHYKYVGKREFKRNGTSINYIFSKRSAENIAEKSKTFTKFLKEIYNVKMVRDIKPEMCIAFLDSKKGCSTKTISAYKNALEKISIACEKKFHIQGFYTEDVKTHKVADTYKTNSSRLYTNEQIEKICNFPSSRQAEIKTMIFSGVRVFELIGIKTEDVNLDKHIFETTIKDNKIDTYSTIKIIGKGGKVSYRPILPQYRAFFRELIKDKQPQEKLFDLPKNTKQTRLIMCNELRRITKELGLAESGKNHEFRKYHSQIAVEYYVSKGWDREQAEKYVIQRHLSHSAERQDLKKIYLYS